jgi:hypothetical protein
MVMQVRGMNHTGMGGDEDNTERKRSVVLFIDLLRQFIPAVEHTDLPLATIGNEVLQVHSLNHPTSSQFLSLLDWKHSI